MPSEGENLPKGKIRIFLAEDHSIVREGLKYLLEAEPGFVVIGEASDGEEALERISAVQPDVVVMDISMPRMNGIKVAQQLKQMDSKIAVLILTVHEDRGYLRELFEVGASGYLLKRSAPAELFRAVRTVAAGEIYIDSHLHGKLVKNLIHAGDRSAGARAELSERESEVLRLIALGYSNKEIAAQLEVSVKSVETYKARAMEKMHLRSRVDIVSLAGGRGWLPGQS